MRRDLLLASLALCILMTLNLVMADHGGSLHYSGSVKTGQEYDWELTETTYNVTTGEVIGSSTIGVNVTVIDDIGGVEYNPITFHEDYFEVIKDGTKLTSVDQFFDYSPNEAKFPVVMPNKIDNSGNYFDHMTNSGTGFYFDTTITLDKARLFGEMVTSSSTSESTLEVDLTYHRSSGVLLNGTVSWSYQDSAFGSENSKHFKLVKGPPTILTTLLDATTRGDDTAFSSPTAGLNGSLLIPVLALVLVNSVMKRKKF